MNISRFKLAWKALTGLLNPWGSVAGNIADYALDVLNGSINGLDISKKERIQAVLNTATRVLAILDAVQWLCPTKWQCAYRKSIDAVMQVIAALDDLKLTMAELADVRTKFEAAVKAWKSPDDETCVDCESCVVNETLNLAK